MASGGPDPRRAEGSKGAVQPDQAGDRHQPVDRRPARAHWGQYVIDNGPVNACNNEPWVEPDEGAPTCQDCAAKATQQMKGHL
jgi:hypothetical protein